MPTDNNGPTRKDSSCSRIFLDLILDLDLNFLFA